MLHPINTTLTCCSISPLKGLMTKPMALLLRAKGPRNMQSDFPDPVAIRAKTSLPCSRGMSASSWPSRKLENEKYFCKTSWSLSYIEQLVSDMVSHGHLQKRRVTDLLLAEAIPECQLIHQYLKPRANFTFELRILCWKIVHVIYIRQSVQSKYFRYLFLSRWFVTTDHNAGPMDKQHVFPDYSWIWPQPSLTHEPG